MLPLNVEQNQTAILQLPDLGSEILYNITSKTNLTVEISGNQLIVVASDVLSGIYILTINTVPESADFKVKVEVLTSFSTSKIDKQPIDKFNAMTEANGNLKLSPSSYTLPVIANQNKTEGQEPAIMTLIKLSNRGLL
jgi:hypothetical protein